MNNQFHFHTAEDESALFVRAAVIIQILAACDSDQKAVAALAALTALTPTGPVNISHCSFDVGDKTLADCIAKLPEWPKDGDAELIVGRDCDRNGWSVMRPAAVQVWKYHERLATAAIARLELLREAVERAERKLSAYVGVCSGDKELTETVLPMLRDALAATEGPK